MRNTRLVGLGALLLLGAASAGAEVVELSLGQAEAWRSLAVLDTVRTRTGRWGQLDLVLEDAAYSPNSLTELLLHFDVSPFQDGAGRYDVSAAAPVRSTSTRMLGDAAAAFGSPENALLIEPRPGSLFWPGSIWGDFTIEFWLYGTTLGDGETVLDWSGVSVEGDTIMDQSLTCTIHERRLVFRFENLFPTAPVVTLAGETPLLPRTWHHHLLRFDTRYGLMEYLVDGTPDAVAHATSTGHEGGDRSALRIGRGTAVPLVVGGDTIGLLDELRISRRFVDDPALSRLNGSVGVAVSRVFDLELTGSRLLSLDAVYDRPGHTDVYFFYRMADRLEAMGELPGGWTPIVPGQQPGVAMGRYLQLKMELLPDGELWESPSVSRVSLRYEPDPPPSPPARLLARAGDTRVHLSWSRVNESDVAGYRVYYGSRPGVYQTAVDVGNVTDYVVEGLRNGSPYYFTVTSYDTADRTRRSAFAPEVGARPSTVSPG